MNDQTKGLRDRIKTCIDHMRGQPAGSDEIADAVMDLVDDARRPDRIRLAQGADMTPHEEVERLDHTINALTKRRDELKAEISRAEHEAGEAELEALVRSHGHGKPVDDCVLCIVNRDLDETEEQR